MTKEDVRRALSGSNVRWDDIAPSRESIYRQPGSRAAELKRKKEYEDYIKSKKSEENNERKVNREEEQATDVERNTTPQNTNIKEPQIQDNRTVYEKLSDPFKVLRYYTNENQINDAMGKLYSNLPAYVKLANDIESTAKYDPDFYTALKFYERHAKQRRCEKNV